MRKAVLGATGAQVTVLGWGGQEIRDSDAETVRAVIGGALDAGLNVIDTAECYGRSEELIGEAVADRRKEYLLFSKCGHEGMDGLPDWEPRMLERSIERSLARLRTDVIDLMQLHTCSKEVLERGDVIEVLRAARRKGKVRWIGYSGDGEAALFAVRCGAFDVLQTSLNIFDQESMARAIPAARERGMGVIAKRPLGNAVFRHAARPANPYHHEYWDRMRALAYDFLHGTPEAAAETALRFTLSVEGVSTAIVGTSSPGRWKSNAALAEKGPLPAALVQEIRARWNEVSQGAWPGQN